MSVNWLSGKRVRALVAPALLISTVSVASPMLPSSASSARPDPGSAARAAAAQHTLTQAAGTAGRAKPHWKPCGVQHPGYDCATMTVPLDYDRPSRGTTQVALARLPASTPTGDRIGSVFVNPGGPGGSGVDMVFSRFGQYLSEGLDGRFDIVGFDPRGVGASDPLHCFASKQERNAFLFSQPVFPYRKGQYRPFFAAFAGLGRECLDDRQRVARNMNTADVARDLDRLRRAVGDPQITYLGFSYGSYLGNTYANLFPDKVRALVIDGVLDPRLWSSGRQIESDRVATQVVFEEFLRLCDEAGSECAFQTPVGSAQRWGQLASKLRRDPLWLPGGGLYTYDFLVADAALALYAPEVWDGPNGAAALFNFLADAALEGKEGAAADAARLHAALIKQLRPPHRAAADYPNGFDAYYGNQCADTQYPRAFPAWRATGRDSRLGSRFGPFWWWSNTGCAHWPVNSDRYVGPWTAHTSAPVLVVGNFFDGVTDYAGAVASAQLLPNSRLLSYAGWGHTAYHRSRCVTDYVHAYLLTVSLPPEGQVCPANPSPFLPATGRDIRIRRPLAGLPTPWLARP